MPSTTTSKPASVQTGATRIGLISDTHGLLRPEAVQALTGCEFIIHAGDIGRGEILPQLRRVAPVGAVRGNVDLDPAVAVLPSALIVQASGAIFYVLHDVTELSLDPVRVGFHFVVTGHTHQPVQEDRNGVLYINPGSAGPRRFRLPVSLALLDLTQKPWQAQFVTLV